MLPSDRRLFHKETPRPDAPLEKGGYRPYPCTNKQPRFRFKPQPDPRPEARASTKTLQNTARSVLHPERNAAGQTTREAHPKTEHGLTARQVPKSLDLPFSDDVGLRITRKRRSKQVANSTTQMQVPPSQAHGQQLWDATFPMVRNEAESGETFKPRPKTVSRRGSNTAA